MTEATKALLAPPVEVPRWFCTFGSCWVIVAAVNEHDARTLVRDRFRQRQIAHRWYDVHVRLARTADLEREASYDVAWDYFETGSGRKRRREQRG